jgi:hypothetical protein
VNEGVSGELHTVPNSRAGVEDGKKSPLSRLFGKNCSRRFLSHRFRRPMPISTCSAHDTSPSDYSNVHESKSGDNVDVGLECNCMSIDFLVIHRAEG